MHEAARLPGFLIIGAMKAGTTTLYRDLGLNARIYMPADKEPANLCRDEVLTDTGKRAYASIFAWARPGQLCGEASTNYSKLHEHPGAAARARQVLGPACRIIYVVREPVSRIVSHHYHRYAEGQMGPDINLEVRRQPRLLDTTRYAAQIAPWIEAFGRKNVRIVVFEQFVADRRGTVRRICEFLDVPAHDHLIDPTTVFNQTNQRPTSSLLLRSARRSQFYRRHILPRVPAAWRERVKLLLPKPSGRPLPPTPETVRFIHSELRDDTRHLSDLLGLPAPLWPLNEPPATDFSLDVRVRVESISQPPAAAATASASTLRDRPAGEEALQDGEVQPARSGRVDRQPVGDGA